MKSLIALVGLMAVAGAQPVTQTTAFKYHKNIGIPEAIRIKQSEAAIDFDGSRIIGGAVSNLEDTPHLVGCTMHIHNHTNMFTS